MLLAGGGMGQPGLAYDGSWEGGEVLAAARLAAMCRLDRTGPPGSFLLLHAGFGPVVMCMAHVALGCGWFPSSPRPMFLRSFQLLLANSLSKNALNCLSRSSLMIWEQVQHWQTCSAPSSRLSHKYNS